MQTRAFRQRSQEAQREPSLPPQRDCMLSPRSAVRPRKLEISSKPAETSAPRLSNMFSLKGARWRSGRSGNARRSMAVESMGEARRAPAARHAGDAGGHRNAKRRNARALAVRRGNAWCTARGRPTAACQYSRKSASPRVPGHLATNHNARVICRYSSTCERYRSSSAVRLGKVLAEDLPKTHKRG